MRLATARVFVRDLTEADHFYGEVLGLTRTAGEPSIGFCVDETGGFSLVVESVPDDAPDEDQELVGRFTGLSFDVDDVQREHDALVARGVRFVEHPERQSWGGTLATFVDPAGNALQIVEQP
jgi:catechol 2,3-dioxygenase-like lactoylglutathione lyase family enzyme